MRTIAVDPGEKNIGLAISDPTGTIANPLKIIRHESRSADAGSIVEIARQHSATRIIVGQSFDDEGQPNFEGRRAARLAAEISSQTDIPVELWDESFSTLQAHQAQIELGSKRGKDLDDLAAVVILQSFLDSKNTDS